MSTRFILGLAIAAALPLSAMADTASVPATTQPDQIVIVRDAETGKLRAATAEEHGQLQSLRASKRLLAARMAPVTPQVRYLGNGAAGVRMTEEMLSYSVIVRGADGKLQELCFASKEEADEAAKKGTVAAVPTALPTE